MHVEGGDEIKGHNGGNEPEGQVVDAPETPTHQNVGNQVEDVGAVTTTTGPVLRDLVEAGNNEPCGIEAQEAAVVEIEKMG